MASKQTKGNETFWQRYKFYIIGLLGAIMLVCFFGVQSVVISYQTDAGESYSAKMDFTVFDLCINCMSMTENAGDIVEKELFILSNKEEAVQKAASALEEIAGTEEGKFLIRSSGVVGNSQENTTALIAHLEDLGYKAVPME